MVSPTGPLCRTTCRYMVRETFSSLVKVIRIRLKPSSDYGGAETTAGYRDRVGHYAHFVYILIYTATDFDGCPVGVDDLVRQVEFVINKLAQGNQKFRVVRRP